MQSNRKVMVLLPMLAAFSLLVSVALAEVTTDTDTATVDVTVANKTIIDISPNSYTVTGIDPGTMSSAATNFDLENLGSKPIDKIEATIVDPPTSNPFETGVAGNYEAGNYLALYADNTTDEDGTLTTNVADFWLVRSRNFNESDDNPRYLTEKDSSSKFEGRIRIDNEEFFFEVVPDATSGVWGNGTLYISETPHNDTQLGDVDLSDNSGISLTKSASDDTVGSADVTLNTDGAADTYCAIVNATGGWVDIVQWSTSVDPAGGCTNDFNVLESGSSDLQPGESKGINLGIRLAFGVMQGSLSQSTLQITATSAY